MKVLVLGASGEPHTSRQYPILALMARRVGQLVAFNGADTRLHRPPGRAGVRPRRPHCLRHCPRRQDGAQARHPRDHPRRHPRDRGPWLQRLEQDRRRGRCHHRHDPLVRGRDTTRGPRGVEEITSRGSAGTRVTYIFTGGAWSHSRGNGGLDKWSSEQLPPSSDLEVAAWQREVEAAVLGSTRVNGIVIRPGTLYGRSGSMLEPFLLAPAYDAAKAGREFDAVGLPDTRLLMVHQDDLADLYLRAGERGPLLAGSALVACNAQSERWTDILDAVVRVSGAKGYRLRAPSDKVPAEVAWASTTLLRPTLAHSLTGWTARKPGLVDGIDMYWPSFVAHYEGKKTIAAWDLPGVVPVGGGSIRPTHSPKGSGSPPRSSPLAG